jgi:hypothetical protein
VAAVVSAVLAVVAVAVLHYHFHAFVAYEGVDWEGGHFRQRRCVGFTVEEDMRDAEKAQCVGVPIGPWYCCKRVNDRCVPESCPVRP